MYSAVLTAEFYQRIQQLAAMPPLKRHSAAAELHAQVVDTYLGAVRSIPDLAASRPSSDGRTIGQVVGHIAEWERLVLQAGGEIASGVAWSRIMGPSEYVDIDGQVRDLRSVDDFNARQTRSLALVPYSRLGRSDRGGGSMPIRPVRIARA